MLKLRAAQLIEVKLMISSLNSFARSHAGIAFYQSTDFWRFFFPFSNTISVNFWFEPKNTTKNDDVKDPEKSDNKSAEALTEKRLESHKPQEDENNLVFESEQTAKKDLPAGGNDKQPNKHNDEVKKDQVKASISEEGEKVETEGEKEGNQEEEEAEIELSAAQYLALLRETEVSLFRATLNHEKVSEQIVS